MNTFQKLSYYCSHDL